MLSTRLLTDCAQHSGYKYKSKESPSPQRDYVVIDRAIHIRENWVFGDEGVECGRRDKF